MRNLIDSLPKKVKEKAKKRSQPSWTQPMLATLTHDTFSSKDWIYERKLDGERCLAFKKGGKVRLLSRNKKHLNDTYPELERALAGRKAPDFIADGEVVAFEGGRTSFSRLQNRMQIKKREDAKRSGVAVYYYLFDLLYLYGYDVSKIPLRHRKGLLKKAINFNDPIRFLTHRNEDGEKYLKQACKKGWEGLIAKEAESTYVHDRSRKWLKFKCTNQQEFVVGGFTEPQGERIGFGALLIGYYKGDVLRYAGKVGTGYDDETLKRLKKKMSSLEQSSPPFVEDDLPGRDVHWIEPKLVAQIGFTEWTRDGRLRHPRYLGLRRDKKPRQVKREKPKG
jgi:DNA ligase D-like protein (predicted ligase)